MVHFQQTRNDSGCAHFYSIKKTSFQNVSTTQHTTPKILFFILEQTAMF
jgi:hypothetical protein